MAAVCVATAALTAAAGVAAAAPDIGQLRADSLAMARELGAPAVAVALIVDDRTLAFAAGRSGRADVTIDASTPFRVGSITKTFVALAALLATHEADFDLDAPLARWGRPPLTNPWPRPVTPRQLLEHTAGLADLSRVEWDSNADLDLDQGLALDPAARTLRWPPGRWHSYTNAGAGPLAWALREATGRSWESWTMDVATRLGMQDTSVRLVPVVEARLPYGFKADGHTVIPWWRMHIGAYGAVNASARDMLRLLQFLADAGSDLETRLPMAGAMHAAMHTPRTSDAARAGIRFGYGLGIYPRSNAGHTWWGHGGDADGFRSRIGYLESGNYGDQNPRRAYFIAINSDAPATLARLVEQLEAQLVADLSVPAAAPEVHLDGRHLAGRYRALTRRFGALDAAPPAIVSTTAGGRLEVRRESQLTTLLPVAIGRYRREQDRTATVAFLTTGRGRIMTGELGSYRQLSESQVP